MELLDRYLQAVVKYLPRRRREDIVQELRANILEQVEDKEAETGRPMTEPEEEVFLKQFGHPMLVAAKYLPQQHLIGPMVFPYYWFTLRTATPLVLLAYLALSALALATEPVTWTRVAGVLARMPGIAINVALWVTAIFAIIEFAQVKFASKIDYLRDWRPRDLPAVEKDDEPKRSHTIFELIASGVFVLWLLVLPRYPFLVIGSGAEYFRFIQPWPGWHLVYWTFVALMGAQWVIELIAMFNHSWRRVRPVLGLAGRAFVVVLLVMLVRAPQLFAVADAAREIPKYHSLVENLNRGVLIGLKLLIVLFIAHLLWDGVQLLMRRSRQHTLMLGHKCM